MSTSNGGDDGGGDVVVVDGDNDGGDDDGDCGGDGGGASDGQQKATQCAGSCCAAHCEWEEVADQWSMENKRLQRALAAGSEREEALKAQLAALCQPPPTVEMLSAMVQRLDAKTMENDLMADTLWQRDQCIESLQLQLEAAQREVGGLKARHFQTMKVHSSTVLGVCQYRHLLEAKNAEIRNLCTKNVQLQQMVATLSKSTAQQIQCKDAKIVELQGIITKQHEDKCMEHRNGRRKHTLSEHHQRDCHQQIVAAMKLQLKAATNGQHYVEEYCRAAKFERPRVRIEYKNGDNAWCCTIAIDEADCQRIEHSKHKKDAVAQCWLGLAQDIANGRHVV